MGFPGRGSTRGAAVNTPQVHQPEPPKPEVARLTQKGAGAKTFFEFGDESLRYGLDDGNASRTWTIEYAELSVEREHFVERNTWWRNRSEERR